MGEHSGEETSTLRELKKISKILILANAPIIEKELSKIASSNARKKIWVLIDGIRMPKDLAREADLTQMAVSYFLNAAAAAEFIGYTQREPPRRILDYVPPSLIDLVMKEQQVSKEEEGGEPSAASQTEEADSAVMLKEKDGKNEQ